MQDVMEFALEMSDDCSLRGVARAAGVSASQLSRLATGKVASPSMETLVGLARACNSHPSLLMVLARKAEGEQAREALRPFLAPGSGVEDQWEDPAYVAEAKALLASPAATDAQLRHLAF